MMAITFENVMFDRVIDSLHDILAEEFAIGIVYDEHRGNQSFLIEPDTDELGQLTANGQMRNVNLTVSYERKTNRNYTKNDFRQVTQIAERMKRLIYNNKNYSVGGSSKWFNATVEQINYTKEENSLGAVMQLSLNTLEIV